MHATAGLGPTSRAWQPVDIRPAIPPSATVSVTVPRKCLADALCFHAIEDLCSTQIAPPLLAFAEGQMAGARAPMLHLAGRGKTESFLGGFVRFHFRHFGTLANRLPGQNPAPVAASISLQPQPALVPPRSVRSRNDHYNRGRGGEEGSSTGHYRRIARWDRPPLG